MFCVLLRCHVSLPTLRRVAVLHFCRIYPLTRVVWRWCLLAASSLFTTISAALLLSVPVRTCFANASYDPHSRVDANQVNLSPLTTSFPVSGIDIALWSQLEINLAIICGSVPALTAFVSKVILGHGTSNNASAGSSRSRRKSRNQSQSLDSGTHDEDQGGGGHPLAIIVHSTIETKSYQSDDQGSERGLVARIGSHGSPIGNVTVVSGPSVSRQG